ncbi:MAG: hypothetical protein IJ083_01530 [Clostridia bacterium]|nr:hypothetical protein [Clostridia bacterium]
MEGSYEVPRLSAAQVARCFRICTEPEGDDYRCMDCPYDHPGAGRGMCPAMRGDACYYLERQADLEDEGVI